MTYATAVALIRRIDINRTLHAAGRLPSYVDGAEFIELLDRADVEEALGLSAPLHWRFSPGNPHHKAGHRHHHARGSR